MAIGSWTGSVGRQSSGQVANVSPASHTPLPQLAGQVPQSAQHEVHVSPLSQIPLPHTGGRTVVVVSVVVVTVSVVLVDSIVVVVAHPELVHASQQLLNTPAQPPAATHRAASRFVRQRVTPRRVMQQVTRPGRPHVDLDAHRMTVRWHAGRSCCASAACSATTRAQRT
jgi:hypothetical protein